MKRPTEATSVIGAALALVTAFGLNLSGEQVAAITTFWMVVVVPGVTWTVSYLNRSKGREQRWIDIDLAERLPETS